MLSHFSLSSTGWKRGESSARHKYSLQRADPYKEWQQRCVLELMNRTKASSCETTTSFQQLANTKQKIRRKIKLSVTLQRLRCSPRELLSVLGDDEVPQHVEGVAIRVHRLHALALLVHLEVPTVIDAHDPGDGAVLAAQPHPLPAATRNPSAPDPPGMEGGAGGFCPGNMSQMCFMENPWLGFFS